MRQEIGKGKRFGRLTAIRRTSNVKRYRMIECRCSCGTVKAVRAMRLLDGSTTSCGCYGKEVRAKANRKHGHAGLKITGTWLSWISARSRCTCETHKQWPNYGGRGIKMCAAWRKDFRNFLADMGEKPEGMTLDRKNNNGDYKPGNCRWATLTQQARNTRANRLVTYKGETKPVAAWAEEYGMRHTALTYRLNRGWTPYQALTRPPRKWPGPVQPWARP